jgi:hypothetical protein
MFYYFIFTINSSWKNTNSMFSNPKSRLNVKSGFRISNFKNPDFQTSANPNFSHNWHVPVMDVDVTIRYYNITCSCACHYYYIWKTMVHHDSCVRVPRNLLAKNGHCRQRYTACPFPKYSNMYLIRFDGVAWKCCIILTNSTSRVTNAKYIHLTNVVLDFRVHFKV